jgi:hypothetical protein
MVESLATSYAIWKRTNSNFGKDCVSLQSPNSFQRIASSASHIKKIKPKKQTNEQTNNHTNQQKCMEYKILYMKNTQTQDVCPQKNNQREEEKYIYMYIYMCV